jgi:7-cyano-7-deazaguanine synthase in queuosine biosynthesis/predicted glutamine amidotransferase
MCGIALYWGRESEIPASTYMTMIEWAEKRGQDGMGIAVFDTKTKGWEQHKQTTPASKERGDLWDFIASKTGYNKITFISCRATPETEKQTKFVDMLQPIINHEEEIILIHNGSVTDSTLNTLKNHQDDYKFQTEIDSEGIIAAYCFADRNMQTAMEFVSGAFAFCLLDYRKMMLYVVSSFNPLAHMYIRGHGYFVHSDKDCLSSILEYATGVSKDGMNVWESWYHHYIDGYTILETDLQSGFQFKQKFKPRFLHPKWKSFTPIPKKEPKEAVLVAASGGIDSGLTAHLLKCAGYTDVEMVHFDYAHRSGYAEAWAVSELQEKLDISLDVIDISKLYTDHIFDRGSMLMNIKAPITSGGENLKSTIAWVAGRNAIFSAILMAIAEGLVLSGSHDKVYISAGWAQLSEETGGYPDNSFHFAQAINSLKDYGYITGSHHIEFLPVLSRITKTETWVLGDAFKFPFQSTVSCDNPLMHKDPNITDEKPALCTDCGSTKLSRIAAQRANVYDPRLFYKERDGKRTYYKTNFIPGPNRIDPKPLIDRLNLPEERKDALKQWLSTR